MTSPLSFLRDVSHQTNTAFPSQQKLSERSQKLISLFRGMLPVCKETIDYQNNHSRLWTLKNEMLLGTVSHFNGKITYIPSDKIINSCTGNPISLKNLKRLQDLQIDLAYVPEQKQLIVFPHLTAAGDDQITQAAAKSLNPKPPVSWVVPAFVEKPGQRLHIFRKADGHFSEDTPENRAYIRAAVSDPANKEAVNNHGVELYSKIMPDGYRAWAHVKNGFITNGGRDKPWRKWVANNNPKGPGGQIAPRNLYTYTTFTFQERVQADRLTEVYNKSVIKNPWKPHSVELRFPARDVGEIHHQANVATDIQAQKREVNLLSKRLDFSPLEMIENSSTKEEESWCSLM